ncbi:MAG: class I SAM-dependent methyltransferase, partial [Bacteroidales bacterium]|nr:class I SAM-dependent methyltransferase [Bacteroidales bacterium]
MFYALMNNCITWQFIENHRDDDVWRLALQGCPQHEVDFSFALQQIAGRQKIKDKLPLLYAHSKICYPTSLALEQCSSQETAHYKTKLAQGALLLDLTAGFGIDTMAFSSQIQQVIAVERQAELCVILQHNAAILQLNNIKVVNADATDFLASCEPADTIYLDPARRNAQGRKVADLTQCEPNILYIKELLLKKCRKRVIIKLSPMIDLKAVSRQLPEVSEIYVVAMYNECKEILFVINNYETPENQHINNEPIITAIDLAMPQKMPFRYRWEEEASAPLQLSDNVEAYLYEPHAALMKAGAYKLLTVHYGIGALHQNTHLYTSSHLIVNFPGHCYQVKSVLPFNKNDLKNLHKTVPCANVAVRNFPLSAEALKKCLKIRDGGNIFLFGVTLQNEKR